MYRARCLAWFCIVLSAVGAVRAQQGDLITVARSNNCFALNLHAAVKNQSGDLFYSPHSVFMALAMTYSGARGDTAEQMASVLCLPEESTPVVIRSGLPPRFAPLREWRFPSRRLVLHQSNGWAPERFHAAAGQLMDELNGAGEPREYELAVANSLWGQEGYAFLDEFLELTDTHYDGTFYLVNFVLAPEEARGQINAWVAERTHDRIPELIPIGMLTSLTRLVLANAIYFKSAWLEPFSEHATIDQPFFLTEGVSIDVPMMNQRGVFNYLDADGLQVLELFYENSDLAMVILLPDEVDGLLELEDSFSTDNLASWLSALQPLDVVVSMPKFEISNRALLAPALAEMGMPLAFDPLSADFSGMTGHRELFITSVVHQAFVQVDESGTEAAAATGAIMGTTSVPPPPVAVFVADRPFLFLIRDVRTGTILFLGRVTDPS